MFHAEKTEKPRVPLFKVHATLPIQSREFSVRVTYKLTWVLTHNVLPEVHSYIVRATSYPLIEVMQSLYANGLQTTWEKMGYGICASSCRTHLAHLHPAPYAIHGCTQVPN